MYNYLSEIYSMKLYLTMCVLEICLSFSVFLLLVFCLSFDVALLVSVELFLLEMWKEYSSQRLNFLRMIKGTEKKTNLSWCLESRPKQDKPNL